MTSPLCILFFLAFLDVPGKKIVSKIEIGKSREKNGWPPTHPLFRSLSKINFFWGGFPNHTKDHKISDDHLQCKLYAFLISKSFSTPLADMAVTVLTRTQLT